MIYFNNNTLKLIKNSKKSFFLRQNQCLINNPESFNYLWPILIFVELSLLDLLFENPLSNDIPPFDPEPPDFPILLDGDFLLIFCRFLIIFSLASKVLLKVNLFKRTLKRNDYVYSLTLESLRN